MYKSRLFMMVIFAVVTVMLINVLNPTYVYADDGTTTDPVAEDTEEGAQTDEDQEVDADSGEGDETDVTESEDGSVTELEEELASEPKEESASDPEAAPEEPADADLTVAEILEQAPDGTEVVVINEEGEIEPLVTEEAAEIVAIVDPMWCPVGVATVTADCVNDTTVAGLLPLLAAKDEAGTIYFTPTYATNDATFDGTNTDIDQLADDNLTLQGGWNGTTTLGSTITFSGTTTFDAVPLTLTNWTGNVFLNDIIIDGAPGTGLQVSTTGNISLDNVDSINNGNSGAVLDSCQYDANTDSCLGNGDVTVLSSDFDDNAGDGLNIDSGGSTTLTNIQADDNDLRGANIESGTSGSSDTVTITDSVFTSNDNGTGLEIDQYGNGLVTLNDVISDANRFGAYIDTTTGTASVSVTSSGAGNSTFNDNIWTGLHIETGGSVSLDEIYANNNGTNGTYIIADDFVTVADSQFNGNVTAGAPEDPGLYVKSGNYITISDILANNNANGAGAVLNSVGSGSIFVDSGTFNLNGTFGVQAQSTDGNITIDNVTASTNSSKGLYLHSSGSGNVIINNNSVFVDNGSYGIYAKSAQGDIDVDDVTVTGNNITNIGALLKAYSGGDIFVDNSTFELNMNAGLIAVASNGVTLTDVTADNNGGNGVEIYTTQTYGCRGQKAGVINVIANVDGGVFTNNGSYGLMVKPGPSGNVVFVNTQTFGGNGLGDYLLDLSDPDVCPDKPPKPPAKPLKVVQVPLGGVDQIAQECESTSGTLLEMQNGTSVKIGCPFEGFSSLIGINEDGLPGDLASGLEFLSGFNLGLFDAENEIVINTDGTIRISFKLPENSRGRDNSILFWDPTLNDGQGGWIQLPPYEFGTSFPLHPDDPEDGRTILSGVQEKDGFLTLTVNFPGIFVLVAD